MSSHREAPDISKDPVADNTDLYAFVSPDKPDTVTILANYIPLEAPNGGPNFYEFGDDVLYSINIDNDGDGQDDIVYEFRFRTRVRNPETFLYNVGPITSLNDPDWNRRQTYSVTRIENGHRRVLGTNLTCPPCNIGPLSTPNYTKLADAAIHDLGSGRRVFAGQREEGFFVDLGSVFDLLVLRPFEQFHVLKAFSKAADGVDGTKGVNVHTIALQVPKKDLTRNGRTPTDAASSASVVGIYASASRRKVEVRGRDGNETESGPFVQVSRLGNPLVNEVIIPMGRKDEWNFREPEEERRFLKYYQHPEVSKLLPVLYPDVFPNLGKLNDSGAKRADLVAILLTGLPKGIVPGFQNFTGSTLADMLRLNLAVPPSKSPNKFGILGGDLAGFPNGRRLADDVVAIELRALAGATYALVAPSFKPDDAAALVDDGVDEKTDPKHFRDTFPYLGTPLSGFDVGT